MTEAKGDFMVHCASASSGHCSKVAATGFFFSFWEMLCNIQRYNKDKNDVI